MNDEDEMDRSLKLAATWALLALAFFLLVAAFGVIYLVTTWDIPCGIAAADVLRIEQDTA